MIKYQSVFIFTSLISLCSSALDVNEGFVTIPKPADMNESVVQDFNIYINHLDNQLDPNGNGHYSHRLQDGTLATDHLSSRGIVVGQPRAILEADGSEKVESLATVAAKVILQNKPEGKPLPDKLEQGDLVLVARKWKDWKFVSDGGSSGWLENKKLSAAPKDIYVRKAILGSQSPVSWLKDARAKWKTHLEIKELKVKLENPKPACPKDLTREEEDGLIPMEPDTIQSVKFQLAEKCGLVRQEKWPLIKKIELKKADCTCREGDVDSFKDVNLSNPIGRTRLKRYTDKSRCREARYHVICYDEMESASPILFGCPKECFQYEVKSPGSDSL